MVVDQLNLKCAVLEKAIGLQLAVQGSRSKINSTVTTCSTYQGINESRQFDMVNLNDYNVILGTPWMYQHQICIGLNLACIVVGSDDAVPIAAGNDTKYFLGATAPSVKDPIVNT